MERGVHGFLCGRELAGGGGGSAVCSLVGVIHVSVLTFKREIGRSSDAIGHFLK